MNLFANDYQQLVERSVIADITSRTRLEFAGGDRHSFLHNLCTNDIKKLRPGQGCEAFITNVQGKCIGFVNVFCRNDTLCVETVPGQAGILMPHFDRYLITEDVTVADRTAQTFEFLVAGPDAANVIGELTNDILPNERYQSLDAKINGANCLVASVPWLKVAAFLIVGDKGERTDCVNGLKQAEASWVDPTTIELARIEAGYPSFGADVTDRNLPQEVDRNETAISFTKGCYLGQETVARLDALGHVNKLLVRLEIKPHDAGATVPAIGTSFESNGQTVGQLTSAAFTSSGSIAAMGYVRCQLATCGTALQVASQTAIVQS